MVLLPPKELHPQLGFEIMNGAGQRRLGHAQRPAEAAGLVVGVRALAVVRLVVEADDGACVAVEVAEEQERLLCVVGGREKMCWGLWAPLPGDGALKIVQAFPG